MARPRSQDKRDAILRAATKVFAERGLSAATSAISTEAGVAEGTLFTYFRTKEELVNALYRELKLELADAMMSGFSRKKSVRDRMRHVWDHYVQWGVANPMQQRVLAQVEVWGGLTAESRRAGSAPFAAVQTLAEDAVEQRLVRPLPQPFIGAVLQALALTTMEFVRQNPDQAEMYRNAGFEVLWAGISRKD